MRHKYHVTDKLWACDYVTRLASNDLLYGASAEEATVRINIDLVDHCSQSFGSRIRFIEPPFATSAFPIQAPFIGGRNIPQLRDVGFDPLRRIVPIRSRVTNKHMVIVHVVTKPEFIADMRRRTTFAQPANMAFDLL
jgi:hypothetical protein